MDKRLVITLSGVAALAGFAIVKQSIVMFVTALAIGTIVYLFRRARTRDRIIAIIAAGLAGSIAAEIVFTLYRHTIASKPVVEGDTGESFLTAISIGVIAAVAIVVVVSFAEIYLRYVERKSEQQEVLK
jgi:uncharacterized membrane protein